jgi:hypothetical protein
MCVVLSCRARLALIVTCSAALVGSGLCAEGQNGEARARAASSRPMEQGRFGLKDADFFRNPDAALASGVARLKKEGFRGLALDAPRSISIADRDRCPVALADIDLARTLLASPLEKLGLLVGTDLRRHRTFVAPVVQPRNPLADGRPLTLPSATQISARSYQIDLRARFGLPWEAGELRVQVLSGDRLSNQVGISLRAAKGGGAVPGRLPPPVFPEPKSPLPSFGPTPSSPAPPSQPGLRLVFGGSSGRGPGLPVYGSFLVRRSAVQIVSADRRKSYRAPIPYGMVTIALVLTSSESSVPEKLEVNAPVFLAEAESPQQDRFAGYFALDLAPYFRALGRSRALYLYAFCDELRTGPIPLAAAK